MRIGIPRALLHYKYPVLWEKFFSELGCEVIFSKHTDKEILNYSVKKAVEEFCLPVKLLFGHVADLKEKVDYIFLPRIVSVKKDTYTCPRFIVLPECCRYLIKDAPPILSVEINVRKKPIWVSLFSFAIKLRTKSIITSFELNFLSKIFGAIKKAVQAQLEYQSNLERQYKTIIERNNVLKLALIGHEYNLHDALFGEQILRNFEKRNIELITSEMIPQDTAQQHLKGLPFVYWGYEQDILGSAIYLMNQPEIKGIISLVSFGCGPESLINEQIQTYCKQKGKPYLHLSLDEHTAKEGIITRIEAFLDLIK